ncbi:MAG: hypothetical protein Q9217_005162 [Psora testacea]
MAFTTSVTTTTTPPYTLPYLTSNYCGDDSPSSTIEAKIRKNLRTFHINLSTGNYASNGPLNALDIHWNYDGVLLISRAAAIAALGQNAEVSLRGVQAVDIYNVVDGNVGATLYRLQGKQSGPFAGLPLQPEPGGYFNALGVERFVFNNEGEVRDLVTVDQVGRMQAQMKGEETEVPEAGTPAVFELPENPQTEVEYRALLRVNMAALHMNVNTGNASANANLAVEDVEVDQSGEVKRGREAFVKLAAGEDAGLGAFPDKVFHDAYVLVDGRQGAVEYVWQGVQKEKYNGTEVKEGAMVRMRGMLFLEFDKEGLVRKVVGVYDERVVADQLQGKGGYLYP